METTNPTLAGGAKRLRLSERERNRHLSAWKHSGQSARVYAAEHGLNASNLYAWSKKQNRTRPEAMERPRVRRERPDGKTEEVPLKSWKMAQSPDEWEAAMMRAVLCGVSTRTCKRLRPDDLVGESRSSISRLWQRKATELVERVQQSDLSGIDLVVLMLDGVVLCKGVVATVALGIDSSGTKHILGSGLAPARTGKSAAIC